MLHGWVSPSLSTVCSLVPAYKVPGVCGSTANAVIEFAKATVAEDQLIPASVLFEAPVYTVPELCGSIAKDETGVSRKLKYTTSQVIPLSAVSSITFPP